jgi:hypothetical protein
VDRDPQPVRRFSTFTEDLMAEGEVYSYPCARLTGVEMSEQTLTEIGYFMD